MDLGLRETADRIEDDEVLAKINAPLDWWKPTVSARRRFQPMG